MIFITCASAALTVALSASSVTTPAAQSAEVSTRTPMAMEAMPLPKDSVCATNKGTGTVKGPDGKPKVGVWVADGYVKPWGARVKTDTAGAFSIDLDKTHKLLWVYNDSMGSSNTDAIGHYDKKALKIKDCIAAPIAITTER